MYIKVESIKVPYPYVQNVIIGNTFVETIS